MFGLFLIPFPTLMLWEMQVIGLHPSNSRHLGLGHCQEFGCKPPIFQEFELDLE